MKPLSFLDVITPSTGSGIIAQANHEEIQAAIQAGAVLGANDANASGFLLSQPLTEFISGGGSESRENLQPLIDAALPAVPTGESFTYLVEDETQANIAPGATDVKRAIGGDFGVDRPKGSQVAGQLDHYGLSMFIDVRQGANNPRVQQHYAMVLQNRINRAILVEGLALLAGAAMTDSSSNWNASDADPDNDVAAMLDAAGDVTGFDCNRVIYGGGAWLKRRQAYSKASRTNGGQNANFTEADVAASLGIDAAHIVKARKRSSATALTKILNNSVIAYEADNVMTASDPSNIKRFVGTGAFGQFQVFVDNTSPVRVKITVHLMALLKITRAAGIRSRAITWS